MKISKIEILRLALPMVHSFEAGFGTVDRKETVITKLYTDNGLVGYGESAAIQAPVYNHETAASCFAVQAQFIAPQIIGKQFDSAAAFRDAYSNIEGNKTAQTGPECAFWHLLALQGNTSLKQLFGGTRTTIAVGEGIGLKPTVEEALAAADKVVAAGYQRIKVKIKPGNDVAVIAAIREKYPDIQMTADGNASYTLASGLDTFKQMEQYGLTMLEQPFAGDNLVDHAALQKAVAIPVCLDESIESVNEARTAVALGSGKIINIKPGRVGGIVESIALHDYAAEQGIGVWCGGMGETGIGRAFNIALASKENFIFPADMSPYQFFYTEDLIAPSYQVSGDGYIDVPDRPGLGYDIDGRTIEKYTVEHVTIA